MLRSKQIPRKQHKHGFGIKNMVFITGYIIIFKTKNKVSRFKGMVSRIRNKIFKIINKVSKAKSMV